jgi:hypothetical protein
MPVQISPTEVVRCLASLVECLPDEVKPHVPESSLCAVLAHDYPESDPLSAVGRAVETGRLDRLPGNFLRLPPGAKIGVPITHDDVVERLISTINADHACGWKHTGLSWTMLVYALLRHFPVMPLDEIKAAVESTAKAGRISRVDEAEEFSEDAYFTLPLPTDEEFLEALSAQLRTGFVAAEFGPDEISLGAVRRWLPTEALRLLLSTKCYPQVAHAGLARLLNRAVETGQVFEQEVYGLPCLGMDFMPEKNEKIPVGGQATANAYRVMSEAVKWGVEAGYRRAHKYTDSPEDDQIQQCLVDAIMLNLSEQFSFGEENEE